MEPYLGTPSGCTAVLKKYGFRFRKQYGQNFLIDPRVLEKTVAAAELTKEDFVLEIGPGIGTLTQYLAAAAGSVLAVEIDDKLLPILADTLSGFPNARVVHGDIMKTDLKKIAEEENGGRPFKVAANLPYYITTPILMMLLEGDAPVDGITVMVQKEVAERMTEGPGSKRYGALSVAVQYYSKAQIACTVPSSAFIPRPEVDSAVVHLKKREMPPVSVADEKLMFRLVKAAFGQRRKMLPNALSSDPSFGLSKDEFAEALKAAGIDPASRGERLSIADFAALSDAVSAMDGGR